MNEVYLVWRGIPQEGTDLLGVFTDKAKAIVYCDEYESNDESSLYTFFVTEEKVIG